MCSTENFISTDAFYLTGLHVLTAIEVPVHSLGAFVIIARTPKKMSNVKWTMLLLHFVVLTLPVCAGYPLGVSLILGIPTSVQVYLGVSFVGVIAVTVVVFFEDRYHRLLHGHISNGARDWKRRSWLVFHYLLSMVFTSPGYFSVPEQEYGRAVTKQLIPCLPSDILSRPGFFVLATNNLIAGLGLLAMSIFLCAQLFFVALCLQIAVPLVVLLVPVLYIVLSIWFNYYNQAYTNIAMCGIALHGIASTVTMLIVHKPYRDATLEIFHVANRKSSGEQGQLWKTRVGGVSAVL